MTLRSISVIGLLLSVALLVLAARAGATERIVSVGGATTEIVYRLGDGDRIVAVDTTSLFPVATARKPKVGYMRALAAEPIIALNPSLVLAVEDSGPPQVLDQLREAGIRVVIVPDKPTADGVLTKVAVIAAALNRHEEGKLLSERLRHQLEAARQRISSIRTRPRVLFLLSVGNGGAPMTGGRETASDGIIRLAGGENAVNGFEGYKPVSPEAIVEAAPDIVLVTSRSLRLLGGLEKLLAMPSIAATPAGKARRVVTMDGLLMLGFGPRIGEAVITLAQRLHPALPDRSPAN